MTRSYETQGFDGPGADRGDLISNGRDQAVFGGPGLLAPADTRPAAQVHAEDAAAELLQVGVLPAHRVVGQAQAAALQTADEDEGRLEDAPLAALQTRPADDQLQRRGRPAAGPELVDGMLAHAR